jgi:hypothetical protein
MVESKPPTLHNTTSVRSERTWKSKRRRDRMMRRRRKRRNKTPRMAERDK